MIAQAQGRGDHLVVDENAVSSLMQQVDMTYQPKKWQKQNLWAIDHVGPLNERQLEVAEHQLTDRRLGMARDKAVLEQEMALTDLKREMVLTRRLVEQIDTTLGKRYDRPWQGAYYQQHLDNWQHAYPYRSRGETQQPVVQYPGYQPQLYEALTQTGSEEDRRRIMTGPNVNESQEAHMARVLLGRST
jgi:hypothetical protein